MALERKPIESPQEPGYPDVEAYASERRKFMFLLGLGVVGAAGAVYAASTQLGQKRILPEVMPQGSPPPPGPLATPTPLPSPEQSVMPQAAVKGKVRIQPQAPLPGEAPAPTPPPVEEVRPGSRTLGIVAPAQPAVPRAEIEGGLRAPVPPADPKVQLRGKVKTPPRKAPPVSKDAADSDF